MPSLPHVVEPSGLLDTSTDAEVAGLTGQLAVDEIDAAFERARARAEAEGRNTTPQQQRLRVRSRRSASPSASTVDVGHALRKTPQVSPIPVVSGGGNRFTPSPSNLSMDHRPPGQRFARLDYYRPAINVILIHFQRSERACSSKCPWPRSSQTHRSAVRRYYRITSKRTIKETRNA